MRFWQITMFIICFNFSLAIVGGLGIFQAVPTEKSAEYAAWGGFSIETAAGIVFGVAAIGFVARLSGVRISAGAIAYLTIFAASAIPLNGWLTWMNGNVSNWPSGLNAAILGVCGLCMVYGFIQLASIGGKSVE